MSNQQNQPIQPPKKVIWMKCRAAEHCEGNQAYVSLIQKHALTQGGGTSYRYRCTTCNGVWHLTR